MNYPHPSKQADRPRILVAPLDWGLGHATRCIPVIYELLNQGAEVWLAGEREQKILLNREFTSLPFLQLRGYRIRYGKTALGLLQSVIRRLPAMLIRIKEENDWLKKMVMEYKFDAVIADNRFGLYHKGIPCVFITHQLNIKSPLGKWSERILQRVNYRYINRFSECWIPDEEKENGLAGELSHPSKMPAIPCHYIGLLSRLKKDIGVEKKKHLFISLSGPEPQRTIFENIIVKEIAHYNGTAAVVRGLPGDARLIPSTNDIHFYNHLPSDEFNREMQAAEFIISRSGYSTVMDIISLGKKSILIPTPGQTEQEYLAKFLSKKKFVLCVNQNDFSIEKDLQNAAQYEYRQMKKGADGLSAVIGSFLKNLKPDV